MHIFAPVGHSIFKVHRYWWFSIHQRRQTEMYKIKYEEFARQQWVSPVTAGFTNMETFPALVPFVIVPLIHYDCFNFLRFIS